MPDAVDDNGYRIPRAHRAEDACSECGRTYGLEPCGLYPHVADLMCETCRRRYDYRWCENCQLNHIKGVCGQVGSMAGKARGV